MLLAFSAFSGTDALVKRLTESLPVPQVTAMITLVALLLVILAAAATGRAGALWPRHPGLAVLRAVLLAGDTLLIYYAFSALPLADAYVLAFLTRFWLRSLPPSFSTSACRGWPGSASSPGLPASSWR